MCKLSIDWKAHGPIIALNDDLDSRPNVIEYVALEKLQHYSRIQYRAAEAIYREAWCDSAMEGKKFQGEQGAFLKRMRGQQHQGPPTFEMERFPDQGGVALGERADKRPTSLDHWRDG